MDPERRKPLSVKQQTAATRYAKKKALASHCSSALALPTSTGESSSSRSSYCRKIDDSGLVLLFIPVQMLFFLILPIFFIIMQVFLLVELPLFLHCRQLIHPPRCRRRTTPLQGRKPRWLCSRTSSPLSWRKRTPWPPRMIDFGLSWMECVLSFPLQKV